MTHRETAAWRLARFSRLVGSRYEVERELASGGTATVFLARDLKYERRVAIKVFRSEVAEAMGHARFVREIALLATLNHPHIVPLLDSGDAEDLLYLVMPAVEGESLRDRLTREGQLPVDDAIQIARDVAVAIDYAHGRSIVHRDVKPENILLTAGTAVVADFGIAKVVNSGKGTTLTRTGVALGTLAYMSPEQAAAGTVDGRTDVYSLGCVLYEMLGGLPPFTGKTTREVVMALATSPVKPLQPRRPEVSQAMDEVLARAMAKSPEERYATATAFLDEMIAARKAASHERMWEQMDEADAQAILERAVARLATPAAGSPAARASTPGGSLPSIARTPAGQVVVAQPPVQEAAGATPGGGGGATSRWIIAAVVAVVAAAGAVAALAALR